MAGANLRHSGTTAVRRIACRAQRLSASSQLNSRVADVPEPALGILFETPLQQSPNAWRAFGRQRLPVRLALENRGDRVGDGVAGERRAAGEHFVEHAAERPDVRPPVERLATRLFRAHVGRGAQDRPLADIGRGQRRRA